MNNIWNIAISVDTRQLSTWISGGAGAGSDCIQWKFKPDSNLNNFDEMRTRYWIEGNQTVSELSVGIKSGGL